MPSNLFQEAVPDTYRVKTYLRPDMYELLTVFNYEQLVNRRKILSFAMSTLLVPYNIRKYCRLFGLDDYSDYLRSSHAVKRSLLVDVLVSVGITRESAEALAVDRHMFVPLGRRPFAYLNKSITVLGDTNVSAPGVVGYMLDATRHWKSGQTVEIGIGSGLHAIAMARLHPRMTIVGTERNKGVLQQLARNIATAGMTDRILVAEPSADRELLRDARQVYLTAAASQDQVRRLVQLGGPGTEWLLPRQLTESEFTDEPESSWLKTAFGSYTHYHASNNWNSYRALEAFTIGSDLTQERRSVMYDTTFVRFISPR